MRIEPGDDDAGTVVHSEWNLLDAFASGLILRADDQPVRPSSIREYRETTSVGNSRSTIGRGSSSRKTRTRGLSTAAPRFVSAVVTQDAVLGMIGVVFTRTKQHPDHGRETGQGDRAGQPDDDDIAPEGPDRW
jgi:hypothetical protein